MEERPIKKSDAAVMNQLTVQPPEKQTGLIPFHKIYRPRAELWREFDRRKSYFDGYDFGIEMGKRLGDNLLMSTNAMVLLSLLYLKTEILDSRFDPTVLGFLSLLQICQIVGTLL